MYKLPETAVRHRVESRYQLSLGQVYSVLKSLYDTQAVDAYRRARDLSVSWHVDGVKYGSTTTIDALGHASLNVSTELGQAVPKAAAGLSAEVRTVGGTVVVAGIFPKS